MKYSVEDIKALVAVEKKVIATDKEKLDTKFNNTLENKPDFSDLYNAMEQLGDVWFVGHSGDLRNDHILFNGSTIVCLVENFNGRDVFFTWTTNVYRPCTWNEGHIVEVKVRYEDGTSGSNSGYHLFEFNWCGGKIYEKHEYGNAFPYTKKLLIAFYNLLKEHEQEIRKHFEDSIQYSYEKKLNEITAIANREY